MKNRHPSPELHVRVGRLVIDETAVDGDINRAGRFESLVHSALVDRLNGDRSPRSNVVANTVAERVMSAIEPIKGR